MKATELLSSLLEKAGIDTSDDRLKDILAVQIDIPDEFANKLNTELMSKAAAKSLVKNEVINDFTKGIHINIEKHFEDMGIEKSEIDEIFKEKATGKVVMAAFKKLAEIKDKSANSTDKEKTLREEIKTLNTSLADYKEKYVPKTEVDKIQSEWELEKFERGIEGQFLGKKWSKHFPEDMRTTLAKVALEKKLAELGAKAIPVGKDIKIVKSDDLASDYFDKSNKLVTFASLADEIMAANKFLEMSPDGGTSTTTTVTAISSGETNQKSLTKSQSLIKDLLKNQTE